MAKKPYYVVPGGFGSTQAFLVRQYQGPGIDILTASRVSEERDQPKEEQERWEERMLPAWLAEPAWGSVG